MFSLDNPIEIKANANLNDYKSFGTYHCPANATVVTLSNCPIKNAFLLVVIKITTESSPTQILIDYDGSDGIYIRAYKSWTNAWDSWRKV